ncbi:Histone-lysine N-methyltransferase SETMAR [Armadillidium nasatum]|uniref:Histone-lysine N-methyltransferase SETMAR n=1 Tax=Armadillidium nasatum TaxID=96803 RepID=A0A5N5TFH7_9CRUS|nr:Histone-lysine N-methyltransferase SETMAR [Armadillidium nasatum]
MDSQFNPKDQKVIVKYLFSMRNDPTEIHKLLTASCGSTAADYKIVKGWIRELSCGNDDNEEEIHSEGPNGIPVTVLTPDPTDPAVVQRIEYLITKDKRMTVDRIAEMTVIPKPLASNIITQVLGLKRVCERWVPRLWTPEQRHYRVEASKELFEKYEDEGENFLRKIIFGDESFIQYYTPDKLATPTAPQRRHSKSIAEERYKPAIEPKQCITIFFFDYQGMICNFQVPEGTKVDAEYYANFLRDELAPAIKRKRKGVNIKDLYLLHDNTPVHNALPTQKALKDIDIQVLPHPPASPDMEPLEYFLIHHLKSHMKGTPFSNPLAIGATIQRLLVSLTDNHFANALQTLANRWESIVDSRGLYVL